MDRWRLLTREELEAVVDALEHRRRAQSLWQHPLGLREQALVDKLHVDAERHLEARP